MRELTLIVFAYDDPAWKDARHAYGLGANQLLAELEEAWDDDAADYLFFSALFHQETTYPASYLAVPHLLRLAAKMNGGPRRKIILLLSFLALQGQKPADIGNSGVSCASDCAWAQGAIGQKAAATFRACLPKIADLCIDAYREDPSYYFASGLAAAEGALELAQWLTCGDCGGFQCPECEGSHEWWVSEDQLGIYPIGEKFDALDSFMDDCDNGTFENANSIAKSRIQPPPITELMARLGPLDPITHALFSTFRCEVTCAHCGWTGDHP